MAFLEKLQDMGLKDSEHVGKKAAYLGAISGAARIMPGFVLTREAYESFVEHNQMRSKIRNLLAIVDSENQERVQGIANEIQKLMMSGNFSREMKDAISEAYFSLNIDEGVPLQELVKSEQEPSVVIRPSPIVEQPGSPLKLVDVKGKERLLQSIKACYASAFTADAIRSRIGQKDKHPSMPVIMQKMVMPYISGDIYMREKDYVVTACYGMGDEKIKPDEYIIADQLEIKTVTVEKQRYAYMGRDDKLEKAELPVAESETQKLNDKQAITLVKLYRKAVASIQADSQGDFQDMQIGFMLDRKRYYFTWAGPKKSEAEEKHREPEKAASDSSKPREQEEKRSPEPSQSQAESNKPKLPKDKSIFSIFKYKGSSSSAEPEKETAPAEEPEQQEPEPEERKAEEAVRRDEEPEPEEPEPEETGVMEEEQHGREAGEAAKRGEEPEQEETIETDEEEPEQPIDEEEEPQEESFIAPKEAEEAPEEEDEDIEEEPVRPDYSQKAESIESDEEEPEEGIEEEVEHVPDSSYDIKTYDSKELADPGEEDEQSRTYDDYESTQEPDEEGKVQISFEDEPEEEDLARPAEEKEDTSVHPLQREEWLQTLKFELSKLLVSCDLMVSNALRTRYAKLFGQEPNIGFDELVDKLHARANLPDPEEIKRIRALRKRFLEKGVPITLEDLEKAYEATENLLKGS